MEADDNKDGARVTRARTRRLSAIDTDVRPSTPLLADIGAERSAAVASPRPTRRSRLNTIESLTPARATRASTARGETPEPTTPSLSAVKRSIKRERTPAVKGVRKQLPLSENINEESENDEEKPGVDQQQKPSSAGSPPPSDGQSKSTPESERRVTRSMSTTPTISPTPIEHNKNERKSPKSPKLLMEIIEKHSQSMSPTVKTNSPSPALQREVDKALSPEIINKSPVCSPKNVKIVLKPMRETPEQATEQAEANMSAAHVKNTSLLKIEAGIAQPMEMEEVAEVHATNVELKYANADLEAAAMEPAALVEGKEEEDTVTAEKQEEATAGLPETNESVQESNDSNIKELNEVDIEQPTLPLESKRTSNSGRVTQNLQLPDLTPGIKTRLIGQQRDEFKKSIAFVDDDDGDVKKLTYPKTPARVTPHSKTLQEDGKVESPLKIVAMKARLSSTPKANEVEAGTCTEAESVPNKIDCIKPFAAIDLPAESVTNASLIQPVKLQALATRLISDDENSDYADDDEHKYVLDEAEEIENYQSGDSMDSSIRREIAENEIPVDGESVGSQDTSVESLDEDELGNSEDDMSFIVSDSEQLIYSSEELEEGVVSIASNGRKKRRRIVSMTSSEDSNKQTAKNASTSLSNASKLSEAAQMLHTSKDEHCDQSLDENEVATSRQTYVQELNKSERFNKTASLLCISIGDESLDKMDADAEMQPLELRCSSGEEDDETEPSEVEKLIKGLNEVNKSVYEVFDSEEDEEVVGPNSISLRVSKIDKSPHASLAEAADSAKKLPHSKSTKAFHDKQKREDETKLLSELSCDMTHLKQLFNPLQKSRRQTLYTQSPEVVVKQPKLQRRSELPSSNDFNPSQSFVETLAETQHVQSKRKRLSKSFSGAAEELPTDTAVADFAEQQHEPKRARKSLQPDSDNETQERQQAAKILLSAQQAVEYDSERDSREEMPAEAEHQPRSKKLSNAQPVMENYSDSELQEAAPDVIKKLSPTGKVRTSSATTDKQPGDPESVKKSKKSIAQQAVESNNDSKSQEAEPVAIKKLSPTNKVLTTTIGTADNQPEKPESVEKSQKLSIAQQAVQSKNDNESQVAMPDKAEQHSRSQKLSDAQQAMETDSDGESQKVTPVLITKFSPTSKVLTSIDTADKQPAPTKPQPSTILEADVKQVAEKSTSKVQPTKAKEVKEHVIKTTAKALPKSQNYYLSYCDSILQAANEAKLEQKKQHIVAGKKKPAVATSIVVTNTKATAAATAAHMTVSATAQETVFPGKKQIKRLQATKKAVKHSIKLLAPAELNQQPKSLARKLSPQPPAGSKPAKKVKPAAVASPQKSSDEENRHGYSNLVKTSAGYVRVTESRSPQKPKIIELIKMSTGIMRVEPSTPTPKYFRELPSSPAQRFGFHETSDSPKTSKLKQGKKQKKQAVSAINSATLSALRFKEKYFSARK